MGVNSHTAKVWTKLIEENALVWGGSMVEFGNQHFFLDNVGRASPLDDYYDDWRDRKPFKYWVNLLGISHVSIDINSKDGALPLDLSGDLSYHTLLNKKFDLGTNFGTTEHIKKQYWAWGNMHNFLKMNGIAMHVLPRVGSWKDHASCYWRYTFEFFERLSDACGYVIMDLHKALNDISNDMSIYAVMRKSANNLFISPEVFNEILEGSTEYSPNG